MPLATAKSQNLKYTLLDIPSVYNLYFSANLVEKIEGLDYQAMWLSVAANCNIYKYKWNNSSGDFVEIQ